MNIKEKFTNIEVYNGFKRISYAKTMMTVPNLVFDILLVKSYDVKKHIKDEAEYVLSRVNDLSISKSTYKGMLSTKIQEYLWSKFLKFNYKVDFGSFNRSVTVPYSYGGKKSTMTVPFHVLNIEICRLMKERSLTSRSYGAIKREVLKEISSLASDVRFEMSRLMLEEDIKMKFSQKIHELILVRSINSSYLKEEV